MWQKDYSIETKASAEVIWKIFADVPNWNKWITDLEKIDLKGPFHEGTEFVMHPRGQGPVSSLLIEVKEKESFTDESRIGDTVIRVVHRIQILDAKKTRVTYLAQVTGPGEAEIGQGISSGFPAVLKALANFAESEMR